MALTRRCGPRAARGPGGGRRAALCLSAVQSRCAANQGTGPGEGGGTARLPLGLHPASPVAQVHWACRVTVAVFASEASYLQHQGLLEHAEACRRAFNAYTGLLPVGTCVMPGSSVPPLRHSTPRLPALQATSSRRPRRPRSSAWPTGSPAWRSAATSSTSAAWPARACSAWTSSSTTWCAPPTCSAAPRSSRRRAAAASVSARSLAAPPAAC